MAIDLNDYLKESIAIPKYPVAKNPLPRPLGRGLN